MDPSLVRPPVRIERSPFHGACRGRDLAAWVPGIETYTVSDRFDRSTARVEELSDG